MNQSVLKDRAVIELSDTDCRDLLDGLVTNKLPEDGAVAYAGLLTPQGKYLFDFLIFAVDGMLLLDCEAAQVDDVLRRLMMYRLRAHVTIERRDDLHVVVSDAESDGLISRVDPRCAALGWRTLTASEVAEDTAYITGYHSIRIRHGVPNGRTSLLAEKDFWLETGAEMLNGVAFDKGCYVGQELTARMHFKTELKKTLGVVISAGAPLVAGEEIKNADGKRVGDIRDVQDGAGLALIRWAESEKTPLVTESGTPVRVERPA